MTRRIEREKSVSIKRSHKDAIRHFVEQVDDETRSEFEEKYSSWRNACQTSHILVMSNPYAVKETETFWDLVEMGERIIPLVVEKMTDDWNGDVLPLYEELQPDKDLHFTDQASRFEGERMRTKRTVVQWVEVSQRG